jgi:hypothetical protein
MNEVLNVYVTVELVTYEMTLISMKNDLIEVNHLKYDRHARKISEMCLQNIRALDPRNEYFHRERKSDPNRNI